MTSARSQDDDFLKKLEAVEAVEYPAPPMPPAQVTYTSKEGGPEPATLMYWPGRGLCQRARWALAIADIPYVQKNFKSKKDILPWDKCEGYLLIGNDKIDESGGIISYCAEKAGLFGITADDKQMIGLIIDQLWEARSRITFFPFNPPHLAASSHEQIVTRFLPQFEEMVEHNGHKPFLYGSSLTMADVIMAEYMESTKELFACTVGEEKGAAIVEPFPNLRALQAHVLNLPQIQAMIGGPNWWPFPIGDAGTEYVRYFRAVMFNGKVFP